jgi:uncharacterized protein (DUF1501 family)
VDAAVSDASAFPRRALLRLALLGGAGLSLAPRAWAVPDAGSAKLLVVFLRGGYDATNVVIPVESAFYYESRPTLAVPRPDPANPNAALPLGSSSWGLHPALKDSIHPLWRERQVAFVPFTGSDDMTRSHAETQDCVESGFPAERSGARASGSGFLNRLAGVLGGTARPVALTDGMPTAMTGDVLIPNVSLRGRGRASLDERQVDLIASMYAGTRFEALVGEGFEVRRMVSTPSGAMGGPMSAEMQAANRNAISARGFDAVARRVARLMRDRFNLAFLDVGGWDTHVNQGGAEGALATRLAGLGQGLASFAQQMGPDWTDTVVVVISEFGRTFRENGTRGTDHGHGTVYWVLGGSVRGGRIAGEQVASARRTLNEDRDWPVLTDYRALLGGLFKRMYGLDAARLEAVLPRARPRDLGLV